MFFDFQFCHCQPNYQFPLIFFLATAFWLFYQLQNWELKQERLLRNTMLAFDFQFCHFQPNYQFPLTISLATAFWLFYQPQNWELKQEQCTQPTKQQLSQNNTLTNELFICTVTQQEWSFFLQVEGCSAIKKLVTSISHWNEVLF